MAFNFFDVLGTRPILGRTFTEEEDRAEPNLAIISYGLWQRRYAGDPGVVNRPMVMNGIKYTVLGVMPRDFVFRDREIDYWSPAHFAPAEMAARGSHYLNVVARLKPGVSMARAREQMTAIARRLARRQSRPAHRPNGHRGPPAVAGRRCPGTRRRARA